MFKLPLAAAIGVSMAMSSAARSDPLPFSVSPFADRFHGQMPVISAYDTPSFARLVAMCADMGFDCGVPDGDAQPVSAAARADAEKRMALYLQDWAEFGAAHPEVLGPVPGVGPWPHAWPRRGIAMRPFGHPGYPLRSFPNGPVFPWQSL